MKSASAATGRYLIVGGAGFIGGHFSDHLLAHPTVQGVTVYDNFSSGREWHVTAHRDDPRFEVIHDDVRDIDALARAMDGCDTVIHLASNPDIAAAVTNPLIDFDQGTALTQNVVEAMRRTGTDRSCTPRAVASTVISASSKLTRITVRRSLNRHTVPASWREKR